MGAVLGVGNGGITRKRQPGHDAGPTAEKTRKIVEAHEQAITDHHDVFRGLAK
jgi:hypothetical protein